MQVVEFEPVPLGKKRFDRLKHLTLHIFIRLFPFLLICVNLIHLFDHLPYNLIPVLSSVLPFFPLFPAFSWVIHLKSFISVFINLVNLLNDLPCEQFLLDVPNNEAPEKNEKTVETPDLREDVEDGHDAALVLVVVVVDAEVDGDEF